MKTETGQTKLQNHARDDKADSSLGVLTWPRECALAYLRAGLSVIPIKADGSKRPSLAKWEVFQSERPTEATTRGWWKDATRGIGVIGGKVSGNLECIDFDDGSLYPPWHGLVEAQSPGLAAKLSVVRTPREPSGYHVRYRCTAVTIPGNLKLAVRPGTNPETGKPSRDTLIETRGEGGYALAPGCPPACHSTGRTYDLISGPALTELSDISAAEREILIAAAQSFDLNIKPEHTGRTQEKIDGGNGLRPGDDYDSRGPDWGDILEPHSWTCLHTSGEVRYWCRPGKTPPGPSATTGYAKGKDGESLLAVFSSNAYPFTVPSGKTCGAYGKFAAYTFLNHGGNYCEAARELAAQGYGRQPNKKSKSTESTAGDHGDAWEPPQDRLPPPPADTLGIWPTPKPIPTSLPDVLPFTAEMLPFAFRGYVDDVAERMQCPIDFPAVAMIVACAGVLGKKLGIRPKQHDDWLVIPNLWGAVVGRPGIMKTPAIKQPFKFLDRLTIEAQQHHGQAMQDYETESFAALARKNAKKKAVDEAVRNGDDPIKAAQQYDTTEPKAPTPRRYLVNDATVEKLGALLNENPNGLTVYRDELTGLLKQLDKTGQEGARSFYLEAHDGLGTYSFDRIGRGTLHIESLTLSLMGGIQPGRLAEYLLAAVKGGAGDDGLLQRFQLLVYPDITKTWRNVDRWPDTQAKHTAWAAIQQLDRLDAVAIGAQLDKDDGPPFLHFSPTAQTLFDDWRTGLENRIRSDDEHPALTSHFSKYRSLVPSLALIFELVGMAGLDVQPTQVGEQAISRALEWVKYLESHARRIYSIVTNSAAIAADLLARRIKKHELNDKFTLRDVYRKHWGGLADKEPVEQAVDLLQEIGWLKEAVDERSKTKPITIYRINPAFLPGKALIAA